MVCNSKQLKMSINEKWLTAQFSLPPAVHTALEKWPADTGMDWQGTWFCESSKV